MDKRKWQRTMRVYEEYEKRFAKARLNKRLRYPWQIKCREEIREETKKMLAYDERLVPEINNLTEISKKSYEKYDVTQLRYTSWENFYG